MKNLQFLFNFDETLPNDPINELVNWSKFGQDWTKIVEFSLIANFDASLIFYESVSMILVGFGETGFKNPFTCFKVYSVFSPSNSVSKILSLTV